MSFMFLLRGDYELESFSVITMGAMICYGFFIWINKQKYRISGILNDIKTAVFLASTLLFLTPVLKSLTVAYSEDTIILLVTSKLSLLIEVLKFS